MPGQNVVGFDQATGRLTLNGEVLERDDPRLWGTAGYLQGYSGDGSPMFVGDDSIDLFTSRPDYYTVGDVEDRQESGGRGRTVSLSNEARERLAGRVQVSQAGVGGFSEVIDPSKVEYDPEFGFVTTPDNISGSDPGRRRQLQRMFAIGMAVMGGAAALEAGLGAGAEGAAGVVGDAEQILASQVAGEGGVTGTGAAGGAGGAGAAGEGLVGGQMGPPVPTVEVQPGLVEGVSPTIDPLTGPASVNAPPPASGNIATRAWNAYNNLSPAARQLIGGALGTGASAALAASRQRDATDQRNRELDRQENQRRVNPSTTTYTWRPIPGGLIANNMNQGGGT